MGAQGYGFAYAVFVSIAPTFLVARAEFSAMCRSIFLLSCLGLAAGQAPQQGKCADETPSSTTCCDVDDDTNAKCVTHVNWAMTEGATHHAGWYNIYDVNKGDSFADFQCALFMIGYNKAKHAKEAGFPSEKHSCPRPCKADVLNGCEVTTPVATVAPVVPKVVPMATAAPVSPKEEKSSVEPWVIGLIVLLAIALLAALMYFLCGNKKKVAKKRVKKPVQKQAAPPPAPEPQPTPQPVSFTMQPVPVTTAYIQQPVPMTTAMPMPQYAAPVPQPQMVQTMIASPRAEMVAMAQPVQMTAMPMAQYAAPVQQPQMVQTMVAQQPVSMFDALDRNGDGVITRAEMAGMAQRPGVQPQMMQYAAPGVQQPGVMMMR